MQKGELFDNRYGEIMAAINANPGISNAELEESFFLSYHIIRNITAAMEKEGDITGRVERWGLYSKTLWHVSPHKECLQEPEGCVSIATRTDPASQATHAVRVHVVEQEAQPATYPVLVHVVETEAQPATYPVPIHEAEEYLPSADHSTNSGEVR